MLLQTIASDPVELLNGAITVKLDSSFYTEWSEPQVVNVLAKWTTSFPHLPKLLSAFSLGALETWNRFTQDLIPNGIPLSLSPEKMMKSFSPPTNGANEGALET